MYAMQKICLFMLLPVLHAGAASSSREQSATDQTNEVIRVVVPEALGLSAVAVTNSTSLQRGIQICAGVALHADARVARIHAVSQLNQTRTVSSKDKSALLAGLITLTGQSGKIDGFIFMGRKSGVTIDPFIASDTDIMFVALGHHEARSNNPRDLYTYFKEEAAWRDFLNKNRCAGIAFDLKLFNSLLPA
jgi:hypothetical protein